MSLPPELRVLCHQLTSTPSDQLPQIIPILLRNVSRCQGPLGFEGKYGAKSDASESSVLVHKFKTQISTLLHGKSAEGRFTAVVLIKAVVAAGGWEVLRGVESWVRGLLSVLGKQDPIPTKRLCILSLTKIYFMAYQYQSLVREITTPTLPNFVGACLNVIFSKSSNRVLDVPYSLTEMVFESFCLLIPRHPTIFRPYNNQIKGIIRLYLAPTLCDRSFVPSSLSESARRLAVLLYHTAAKNTSGEEWAKGIRALISDIHGTVDQIYRAVNEDWESTTGYLSKIIDTGQEAHGGAKSEEDLPAWNGIDAGVQRLVGMLELLREHFKHQTANAVTVPIHIIVDLLTRLLSVVPATNAKGSSDYEGVRLNPAIERSEREGLWAGLESIHVATLEVYLVLIDRLQDNFISSAQRCLSQITWVFPSHIHNETFRSVAYRLLAEILPLCGSSLDKSAVALLNPAIRACCKELSILDKEYQLRAQEDAAKPPANGSSANFDMFLSNMTNLPTVPLSSSSIARSAAMGLLPLFFLHIPQQHLQGNLRAKVDQTVIVARHKDAMLASVLNPYLGKNGRGLSSILPHLCREFSVDPAVEAFLRPRLPVLKQGQVLDQEEEFLQGDLKDDDNMMEDVALHDSAMKDIEEENSTHTTAISYDQAPESSAQTPKRPVPSNDHWGGASHHHEVAANVNPVLSKKNFSPPPQQLMAPTDDKNSHAISTIIEEENDDSDESVHLTMDLSESDDESVS